MKYPLLCNNAEDFISYDVNKRHPELKPYVSSEPQLGAIVVQEGKGSLAGHVMVVEKIIDANTLLVSESAYGAAWIWRTREITKTKAWDGTIGWGNNATLKFENFIHNPAVEEELAKAEPEVDYKDLYTKAQIEITKYKEKLKQIQELSKDCILSCSSDEDAM